MNRNQLWGSILQQAISGKLVEQLDSESEVNLIGPAPALETVPFDIPTKWRWVELGKLLPFGGSTQVDPKQIPSGSWLLGLEEIESHGDLIRKCRDWSSVGSNKNVFYSGNVLYSKMRPYLNKVIIADEDGFCTTELLVLDASKACVPLLNQFLLYFLRSPYFVSYAKKHTHGEKPRLVIAEGKKALVPIPPLEEQSRIVARLNEIRPLVEKFSEEQEQLVKLEADFPSKLKASVLQQAIKGLLVPQLDCEPEVEQVGPAPKPDEVPFELPPKWKWVQAKYLGSWKSGATPRRNNAEFWEGGTVPWLKTGEVSNCLVSATEEFVTEKAVKQAKLRLNPKGSVLVAMYGTGTVGNIGILGIPCTTNQACCACITNSDLIVNWYLFYVLLAFRNLLINKAAGTTNLQNLSKDKIEKTWIPLPPLEEQSRIVAKVEELLAGVKQLSSLMEYA